VKLAILHLSDIHLKSGRNAILSKFPSIRGVLEAHRADLDACVAIVSGDIAFSGKDAEYIVADTLVTILKDAFRDVSLKPYFYIVPGNHDCDFTKADKARELVLQGVLEGDEKDVDDSVLESCLRVQEGFFKFLARHSTQRSATASDKMAYNGEVEVDGRKIRINCFNTAWISKDPEKQGEVFFPVDDLHLMPTGYEVVISVFHHPYSWLPVDNAHLFRKHAEENSDIILTGHEHEGTAYTKEAFTGENTTHLEGGVLQDSQYKEISTFNLLLIDTDEKKFRVEQYQWKGDLYTRYFQSDWRPFIRGKLFLRNEFPISSRFVGELNDPGAQFNHPHKDRLALEDIFVPPDFREFLPGTAKRKSARDFVTGAKVLKEINDLPFHLITGADKSGKTALAKQIYLQAHARGVVPIFLSGRDLKKTNVDKVEGYIEDAFSKQYSSDLFERFTQLPKDKKLLILDDFQTISLGVESKVRLLRLLRQRFDAVVVFGDDVVRIQEVSARRGHEALFADFKQYQILELGYVLRAKLVEKWLAIGRDEAISIAQQQAELKENTRLIEVVLGKNLIPSYPLFVLVLLQQIATHTPTNTTSGSYGYFYEYLITEALAVTSAIKDVNLKYNYISELAYRLFQKKQNYLSDAEFEEFHRYYNDEYKLSVRFESIRDDLLNSGIFGFGAEGNLRFKYRYVYYYFVARHLSSTIREEKTIQLIDDMSKRVHREEYANILIFLSYLSKDPLIIETILKSAAELFSDFTPCDLDGHVEFLNRLHTTIPELMLGDGDPRENRMRLLKKIDDASKRAPISEHEDLIDREEDEAVLNDFLRLNVAFKTVEILGQILRNYAGSMKGDQKIQLTSECFNLGFRTLSFIYSFVEKHLEGVIEFFLERLEPEDVSNLTVDNLLTEAKRHVFLLTHWWAVIILRRLSHSAGSAELEKTYAELLGSSHATSVRLIDFSIKLDHFRQFPEDESLALAKDVKDNYFTTSVLRRVIATHFYMTYVDPGIRDRICAKLGIPISTGKVLEQRTKKQGRPSEKRSRRDKFK
jgi:calcineurin-like phosphoesterase family protein